MHLLLRLLPVPVGCIWVNGQDLAELAGPTWRQRIALVAQDGVFFHGTLAENLRLAAPEASEEALLESLAAVGLAEIVQAWPAGLATPIGERGLRLSGGQRQRLSLARAWLCDPDLLILDEATSALDMLAEAALWRNLRQWRAGRTTILVTHRQALAKQCDHVLHLAQGRVVASGDPTAVLASGDAPVALAGERERP